MKEAEKLVINADQAKVTTVSISIQVVRIDNKQMTLAVFQQLVRKPLIDWKTLQLRGVPWGWVNYHKGCSLWNDHLHIIWQDGNRLLRSDVCRDDFSRALEWKKNHRRAEESLADAVAVLLLRNGVERDPECWQGLLEELRNGVVSCRLGRNNLSIATTSFPALDRLRNSLYWERERFLSETEEIVRNRHGGEIPGFQELWKEAQAAAERAEKVLDRWSELYSSLENLPQLFIAV